MAHFAYCKTDCHAVSDERLNNSETVHPCVLTIAGSDSGGNAGVQADLRTFHAHGLHGCTVFTALTAQNPNGVYAIHNVNASFVSDQLDAVLGTYSISSLKTGMLSDPEIIETIAQKIAIHKEITKVIDPVMVATSGASLTGNEAIIAMCKYLLPIATIVTPNLPEAETLAELAIKNRLDIQEAAKRIHGKFGCAVLIKGGHDSSNMESAEDILFDGKEFSFYSMPWIKDPISTHGTGCSLSAAIASELALGIDLSTAIKNAKQYVYNAIANSYLVGDNCGVLG
jgi:hydroxymethylpyrimidine kinase/phosphomethylpyrimidine kinase